MTRYGAISLIAITILGIVGCGEQSNRKVVTGTVTWRGQPVPVGLLVFDPDVKRGNRGPQGGAKILEGRFDTRNDDSKGCVPGAHTVTVFGYSGQNVSKFRNFGDPLFEPHNLEVVIPEEGGNLDLVVPDSVVPAATGTNADL